MSASDDIAGAPRLLTPPFVLASASHFLHALSFNLFLHLPGYLKALGATELEIGLLFGVTAATAIAARPLIGRAMDTRGRRIVIVAGGVLSAIVCALYLTVGSLGPWIGLLRILHGVGEAMLFASLFAYAADIVPPARRIEGIALFGVSGMLPMGLGGLLGDRLLAGSGYGTLFVVASTFSVLAVLLSLPLRDAPVATGQPPRGLLAALTQPDLVPLWFVGVVFATALAAHFTFMKTFVLHTGIGSVGLFFSAYSGAAIVLRVLFGSVPERIGPKRALFPAMASMAVGYSVLSQAAGWQGVATAGVLCGLGHGYTFPILLGAVVTRCRPSERGAALSIFTALFDGGMLLGAPVLGWIIRIAGYQRMFATAAGLVATGAMIFAIWDRKASR